MLGRLWRWFRDFEPAQLNAIKTAALALAATLGFSLAADVEGKVTAAIAAAIVIITEVQALLTRFGVFAPATVSELTEPQE